MPEILRKQHPDFKKRVTLLSIRINAQEMRSFQQISHHEHLKRCSLLLIGVES